MCKHCMKTQETKEPNIKNMKMKIKKTQIRKTKKQQNRYLTEAGHQHKYHKFTVLTSIKNNIPIGNPYRVLYFP